MTTRGFFTLVAVINAAMVGQAWAAVTVYPAKDGTLVDGGVFGVFDGVADAWDWTFNESSYEGSITLATESPSNGLEHRVVWEYNLASVSLEPPVSAVLHFSIRAAPIWPYHDVHVHVYAYPADLVESSSDFHSGPTSLQGSVAVEEFQPETPYQLDVSTEVTAALLSGTDKVGFRFQIDPDTSYTSDQAFIDALDTDPTTKPYLVIDTAPPLPGDFDGDGRVDLLDFATFALCFGEPVTSPPSGCSMQEAEIADLDGNGSVNLADFATFAVLFTG